MKEIWKPINPQLDIEDCYEVSNLGRIRNTKYNKIQDDIHHSTNGFDYIFIATKDHKPSYQHIDVIVCMTFCPNNVNNVECGKPIIPYHKDGDTQNNEASNLEFIEDIEEWKPVVYKDIIPDRYFISNHGRVYDKKLERVKNINGSSYVRAKFQCKKHKYESYEIHRIIGFAFVEGYQKGNIINHIDNTFNNHWRNLEWCTYSWNNKHSMHINQYNGHLTIDQVDYIRDLLIEYKSIAFILELLSGEPGYENISYDNIEDIKCDNESYVKSWKYTQYELHNFMNMSRQREVTRYSLEDIIHFCEVIKNCEMDIIKAHDQLISEGYSVMRYTLYKIKNKVNYKEISDKYF